MSAVLYRKNKIVNTPSITSEQVLLSLPLTLYSFLGPLVPSTLEPGTLGREAWAPKTASGNLKKAEETHQPEMKIVSKVRVLPLAVVLWDLHPLSDHFRNGKS